MNQKLLTLAFIVLSFPLSPNKSASPTPSSNSTPVTHFLIKLQSFETPPDTLMSHNQCWTVGKFHQMKS